MSLWGLFLGLLCFLAVFQSALHTYGHAFTYSVLKVGRRLLSYWNIAIENGPAVNSVFFLNGVKALPGWK